MSKPKILIQLDTDHQPSVFDAVVAVDAGVEHLFRHQGVNLENIRDLVHGAMFTRGPQDLHRTALFVGGADVAAGEELLRAVEQCFFGPMRVSVMLDSNGANTTAAAAVLAAARHVNLAECRTLVLGGTGPVGARVARLIVRTGGRVRPASRSLERAASLCGELASRLESDLLEPVEVGNPQQLREALQGVQVVISAGAAGAVLLPEAARREAGELQVAIDLNAVPPLGIEGVEVGDRGELRDGVICYGAIGVGGTKMKIHKAALRKLFETNDAVLDAEEILALGAELG